jgi:hypothetical protein
MSQPAPPPARSPEREGLLCHHPAPPIREPTVMVGRCHRTCCKTSSSCPRELTTHAGQSTPAHGAPAEPDGASGSTGSAHRPPPRKIRVPVQCRQPLRLASDRPLPARRPVQNKFRACPASRFPRSRSRSRSRSGRRQRASQNTSGHPRRLQRLQRRHTPDNVSSPRPESRGPYTEDTQIRTPGGSARSRVVTFRTR